MAIFVPCNALIIVILPAASRKTVNPNVTKFQANVYPDANQATGEKTARLTAKNCKKKLCDFGTGKCIDCKEGLYGIYCNLPCDNFPAGVCGRFDGNCIESTTLQYSSHTRRELLIEKPVTIAFISFGTLSVIVVSLLIYKLCRRSSSETRDVKTKFRCDATTVYFSSAYDEINAGDMQSYNSTETGDEIQFREDSETSSENDSLIIPQWLWHMENSGQSSNMQHKDGGYLLPVNYEKNY